MPSNTAWRGAIELAGFPVNVALYSRVKKTRNESFRNLAPSGEPVESKSFDPKTGKEVGKDAIRKGVKVKGGFAVMTPEALEQIAQGTKTELATPNAFCPIHSIAWDLAIDRFAVRPDEKVAGSSQSTNIVWNGLKSTGLAYVTQMAVGSGHDAILAIYADDRGLWAALLPFEAELYDVPTHEFEENSQAANLFAQALDTLYEDKVGDFDHSSFVSEYRTRRQAAIDAVIAGETVEVTAPEPKQDAVPDLMAVLTAAAGQTKPKAKTTKKEKVAA